MSSETPPSYNQLNYNDNLSRFFNSQPKTLSEKEVKANDAGSESPFGESWYVLYVHLYRNQDLLEI